MQNVKAGLRVLAKETALLTLSSSGILRLGEHLARHRLRTLTYHRVMPRSAWLGSGRPPNTLFTDEFDAQMAYVAKRLRTLNGNELRAALVEGAALQPHSIAITFDDGYENNYTYALPILQHHGLHAVFFVTTGFVGTEMAFWFDRLDHLLSAVSVEQVLTFVREIRPNLHIASAMQLRRCFKRMDHASQDDLLGRLELRFDVDSCVVSNPVLYQAMNWDQVRGLIQAGMTVGAHTVHHQILSAVPAAQVRLELEISRARIEQETGRACWCFAYPNGQHEDFRDSDQIAVRDAAYLCAFTQVPDAIADTASRYALPRVPIPDVGDLRIFRMHVAGLRQTVVRMLGR